MTYPLSAVASRHHTLNHHAAAASLERKCEAPTDRCRVRISIECGGLVAGGWWLVEDSMQVSHHGLTDAEFTRCLETGVDIDDFVRSKRSRSDRSQASTWHQN